MISRAGLRVAASLRVVRAVLRNPALRRVQLAFLLFNAVEFGTWVAVLLYAYQASGPGSVGLVAFAQLAPAAIFAPFAASLADRYPRDRVLLGGYLVQALAFGAAAGGMLLGFPPAAVYAAAACAAAALTITRPAQGSLLPALARTPDELTAANGISGTVEGAGMLVGPLAAAAMLVVGSPGAVLAAGTVAVVVAALLVARLPQHASRQWPAQQPHAATASAPPGSAGEESVLALVAGGLQALAASGDTRLVVAILALRMLAIGAMDVLFVLLALEVFGTGESGAGILTAALGLGTVLGGTASFALVGRRRLAPALALSAIVWGSAIVVVGTVTPAWMAPAVIAAGGIGFAACDVTGRTILQRVTPDRMLARILGALEGIGLAALALGAVLVPVLVAGIGTQATMVVFGLLLPAGVALAWIRLRDIDRRSHIPERELALLSRSRIFAPLPPPQLEAAARHTRWLTYETGDVLIREGDVGDRYYLLASGALEVLRAGKVRRIVTDAGEGVGETALLHDVPRNATITAVAPTVVLALERPDFLEAVTGHDRTSEIARLTAERIRVAGTGDGVGDGLGDGFRDGPGRDPDGHAGGSTSP